MIWRYIKQISHIWSTWIFAVSGILGIYTQITGQNVLFLPWVYWVVAGVCLLVANIVLFSNQEQKIKGFESEEAELQLNVDDAFISIDTYAGGRDGKSIMNGLVETTHIPYDGYIIVRFTLENIGMESGVPECELLLEKSNMPTFLKIRTERYNKYMFGSDLRGVNGKEREKGVFNIPVLFADVTASEFIQFLKISGNFNLLIKYRTKRIGSYGKYHTYGIKVDIIHFRLYLLSVWRGMQLTNLVEQLEAE